MAIQQGSLSRGTSSISRAPRPSSLADVLDLILDKGLVIDAYIRVSVIGIEILTVDLRVVVASVDTYLRFAEAVNRLDLTQTGNNMTLQDLQRGGSESVGRRKTEGALEGAKERVTAGLGDDDQGDGGVRGALGRAKERVAGGEGGEEGGEDGGDRGPAERVKERVGGRDRDERRERRREDDDRGSKRESRERDRSRDDDDSNGADDGGIRGLVGKVADRAKWS